MEDSRPRPKAVRRFSLLDGMILIAAAGVGLAPLRWLDGLFSGDMIGLLTNQPGWSLDLLDQVFELFLIVCLPITASLSLAVLALRLRRPRPRWRLLARQPGLVACLAAIGGLATGLVYTVFNVLSVARMMIVSPTSLPYASQPMNWITTFAWAGPLPAGFAVAVAWATQALVGRWRAEPSWVDRLGRLVGCGWMALGVACCYLVRAMTI